MMKKGRGVATIYMLGMAAALVSSVETVRPVDANAMAVTLNESGVNKQNPAEAGLREGECSES